MDDTNLAPWIRVINEGNLVVFQGKLCSVCHVEEIPLNEGILSKFPSRSAEGGEFNGRFKNDRLTIEMDSGIKFSFNFNKKYCSMFGYQLTIIVLTVWAVSVSKL